MSLNPFMPTEPLNKSHQDLSYLEKEFVTDAMKLYVYKWY